MSREDPPITLKPTIIDFSTVISEQSGLILLNTKMALGVLYLSVLNQSPNLKI